MNLAELDALIKDLESELQAAKAFRPVLAKRESVTAPAMEPQAAQAPLQSTIQMGYGAGKSSIMAAIKLCPMDYTVFDVEKHLVEIGAPMKRETISQVMSRLAKNKEIIVKTPGSGRRPTIFAKDLF